MHQVPKYLLLLPGLQGSFFAPLAGAFLLATFASLLVALTVTPSLWRHTIAWWTGRTALSVVIAVVIAVLAPLIAISLPQSWGAFVAGIGVLAAFAAAVAFAWPAGDD